MSGSFLLQLLGDQATHYAIVDDTARTHVSVYPMSTEDSKPPCRWDAGCRSEDSSAPPQRPARGKQWETSCAKEKKLSSCRLPRRSPPMDEEQVQTHTGTEMADIVAPRAA